MIKFILAVGFLLVPLLAEARVDVVKILSLSCPICYSSETQDAAIASAVFNAGGKFVPAPVPTNAEDSGEKELIYYAARDRGIAYGETVKRVFYKGLVTWERLLAIPPKRMRFFNKKALFLTKSSLQSSRPRPVKKLEER